MNPKISIIVPVYNSAPYLMRCLDSILAQTFRDWECICIDDGSTDESRKILLGYADRDGRFKVIHQQNGGVSAARQKGLENAKGDWISWYDSDDWSGPENLEHLYAGTLGVDFVWSNYWIDNHGRNERMDTGCADDAAELNVAILTHKTWAALWNKLFSRSYIERLGIGFPADRLHDGEEDVCFTCSFLTRGVRIRHVDSCDYHYVIRKGSLIHSGFKSTDFRRMANVCIYLSPLLRTQSEQMALRMHMVHVKRVAALSLAIDNECYYSVLTSVSLREYPSVMSKQKKFLFWLVDHHLRSYVLMLLKLKHTIRWLRR